MSEKSDEEKKLINKKIREDKIFNNRYKTGDGLRDEEDYTYDSSIKVNPNYSAKYLNDLYNYEEGLDYNIGLEKIFKFIKEDPELKTLLEKVGEDVRIKLSKEEINYCFDKILTNMESTTKGEQFYNPIYILEAMSSILYINSGDPIKDYKKIFDALSVETQEELVIELNKKYKFLEGKMNRRKIH